MILFLRTEVFDRNSIHYIDVLNECSDFDILDLENKS